ncbi:YqjK family protein [Hydrogenophaga sp.]|uniref:YqjK family protein n=1 Tax=Hydrogenophaga sp. TaxID=1904254 RepID=UPI001991B3DC|nr:YqjK family protein [Hydrogenophaga sp.]MBD3893947.1 hypothetical protein [Hydrogenophaga sp.]
MSGASTDLALRRQRLVQRSTQLRLQLQQQAQQMQPAFHAADRLQDGWHWLRRHPGVAATGLAALLLWRPRQAFSLSLRAWSLWRLWQRLRHAGGSARAWF